MIRSEAFINTQKRSAGAFKQSTIQSVDDRWQNRAGL